jgi:enoyl-CoA hydratase
MAYENIIYDVNKGTCRIIMNRPDAMNAFTPVMLEELAKAVNDAGSDSLVRVIVLTGAGMAFCAGVDLKFLGDITPENGKVGDVLDIPARDLVSVIRSVAKPVIAMVNGFCFTGALEIMLACDMVIASEDAKIGDTHAKWGLRPTWGMSARLPRRVGFLKAKELSFTAGTISGKEAERIGLVNRAVPAGMLEEALRDIADRIIANSEGSVSAYKRLYNTNEGMSLDESLQFEFGSNFEIGDTAERLAGFRK